MRIPVSGTNDEALVDAATDCRELISGLGARMANEKKAFWLRGLVLTNEHSTDAGVVELWDQDEGAGEAANQKLAIIVPANTTLVLDFPPPGIKFETNCVASASAGTFAAYSQHAMGYLE